MLYYLTQHSPLITYLDEQEGTVESIIARMGNCQGTWRRERRGEDLRFRGIGCGNRDYDPLCGSYQPLTYSREASRQMLDAISAVKQGGTQLESYGLAIVLPLKDTASQRIDNLLFESKSFEWESEVTRLYSLASKLLKRWFGKHIGFELSLDYAGESKPWAPHYQVNAYVFPAQIKRHVVSKRKVGSRTNPPDIPEGEDMSLAEAVEVWINDIRRAKAKPHTEVEGSVSVSSIPHWFTEAELESMRHDWRDVQNEAYGLSLTEADIKVSYIPTPGKLYHWLRYLYRHPLSDIWRGWRGYNSDTRVVTYSYKKPGQDRIALEVPADILSRAYERLDLIPQHFKRIRWFGVLSDGQRSTTMSLLGLERVERDDSDDDKWVAEGYFNFVRYDRAGIVLEDRDTGWQFTVSDKLVSYEPAGVRVGKRIVWQLPRGSPASSKA